MPSLRRTLLAAALGLGALAAPASSAARSYSIQSFHAVLRVQPDARLTVIETISFRFNGSYEGVYRTIPVDYRSPWGTDYGLRVKVLSVHDEDGKVLRREVSRRGRYLQVKCWVPGAQDAVRTVTFAYDVWRAVKPFRDHDELYWNATGNEWDVPIAAAEADVRLPEGVPAADIHTDVYTGVAGSKAHEATVETEESVARFRAARGFGYREGMTVVAGWPRGRVKYPSRLWDSLWFVGDNPVALLPALVLGFCFFLWWFFGRDPDMGSIAPEYQPPEKLTAAEAGALIDDAVDTRDVCAMAVDLSVRGYMTMEEVQTGDGKDVYFKKKKDFAADASLKLPEKKLLGALFRVSDSRMLYELKNAFYADLAEIKSALSKGLIQDGYYLTSPGAVRGGFAVVAVLVAAGGFVWISMGGGWLEAGSVWASAAFIAFFGWWMPRKTPRGAWAQRKVLGFQEFIRRAEKDRIERLPPDAFHRWLPYAMALGVVNLWTQAFAGVAVPPPTWYVSRDPFDPAGFGRRMDRMSSTMGSAFSSQPRQAASGGSGSSSAWGGGSGLGGGGFSGGGFGGGGSGAF